MVRKCAEHNEGELSTLEEISLHQRDIERIEHLHRWCPRLRIVLLQGNLISRIENMSRFRDLEYLNLALNNLEVVEGLERCECLTKLDFTANFITDLTSLASLQDLPNLRELYLTGNPCTSYRGYRSWMICTLTAIEELDGITITRSERLKALQELDRAEVTIKEDQQVAMEKRAKERRMYVEEENRKGICSNEECQTDEEWWHQSSEHTPEARLALHKEMAERRKREEDQDDKIKKKRQHRLFTNDGRPLNVNTAKLEFQITEDEEENQFVLEVHTYKYMDSSLISCDVEPWYVRVTVKGKILQLVLLEEVKPGQSTAQWSKVTGHLIVTMPKLLARRTVFSNLAKNTIISLSTEKAAQKKDEENHSTISKVNAEKKDDMKSTYLEIGERNSQLDYTKIVQEDEVKKKNKPLAFSTTKNRQRPPDRPNSPGFVDDENVPPLE